MALTFGEASDFYRLRVVRLDDGEAPDLEWRDDILYRSPPAAAPDERVLFRVEAVSVDDPDSSVPLADFATSDEAHSWLRDAEEEMSEMTKSEFESAYLTPGE